MSSTAETYVSMLFGSSKEQQQQNQQNKHNKQSPPQQRPQEKPFAWRMYPNPERKYQLFPKDKQQPPLPVGKGLDPEQAFALAMGQNRRANTNANGSASDKDKTQAVNGLRLRMKEHNLTRRRKISVPELGPMTTVQEVAMDSRECLFPSDHAVVSCSNEAYNTATIPGRPPIHEQSISAPGNNWRQHLVACMAPQSEFDELAELDDLALDDCPLDQPRCNSANAVLSPSHPPETAPSCLRQPLSPKSLAPLIIPPHHTQTSRSAATPSSSKTHHFRSGSTPVENTLMRESPHTKTPYAPVSAPTQLTTPNSAVSAASAATSITSTVPTPVSGSTAQLAFSKDLAASPKPLPETDYAIVTVPKATGHNMTEASGKTGGKTTTAIAAASAEAHDAKSAPSPAAITVARILSHRRGQSESGSIMERGRPRKRSASREGAMSAAANYASGSPSGAATVSSAANGLKRTGSKASKCAERRAFQMLPRGCKAVEAPAVLGHAEATTLAAQALQQTARFEVLRKEDVENLSRELRNLDERTDYLRRTYTSLRAGRRNLHSRICQYLRSPRVAKFSHDAMLRQEEALADLDASIDDWVTKLEQAENRRTRVRQKLLEHVAASATLPLVSSAVMAGTAACGAIFASTSPINNAASATPANTAAAVGVGETLQHAMGVKPPTPPCDHRNNTDIASCSLHHQKSLSCGSAGISTPPRSPAKAAHFQPYASTPSPSPQRPAATQVPSTILEQPQVEEAMATYSGADKATAAVDATNNRNSTGTAFTAFTDASLPSRRVDVESIRIYAGDDVYALLADVENQISSMSRGLVADTGVPPLQTLQPSPASSDSTAHAQDCFTASPEIAGSSGISSAAGAAPLSKQELRELHRARSHELLHGKSNLGGISTKKTTSSRPCTPAGQETNTGDCTPSPADSDEIFLTDSVFQPERSVLVL